MADDGCKRGTRRGDRTMILWFQLGSQIAKVKIDTVNKLIYMAGSRTGIDKFICLNTQFNEQEKKEHAEWVKGKRTDEDVKKEIMDEYARHGFKLIHIEK